MENNRASSHAVATSLILANLILVVLAVACYRHVSRLEKRVHALEYTINMSLEIDGRIFIPSAGQDIDAFLAVVEAELALPGSGGFTCSTLTGCNVPGGSITICTGPGEDHEAAKQKTCVKFRCDGCNQ